MIIPVIFSDILIISYHYNKRKEPNKWRQYIGPIIRPKDGRNHIKKIKNESN